MSSRNAANAPFRSHLSKNNIPWLLYTLAKKRHEFTPSAAASKAATIVNDAIGRDGRPLSLKI